LDRIQFPVLRTVGHGESALPILTGGDVNSLKQFSVIEEDISADNPEFSQSQSATIILDVFFTDL
jgi:hypothetical protein